MAYEEFDLQTGQELQSAQLSFRAYGCLIDNVTNQWYQEGNSRRWIPPYTIGVAVTLMGATTAQILHVAPESFVQVALAAGEYLVINYTDLSLATNPGQQTPQVLGSVQNAQILAMSAQATVTSSGGAGALTEVRNSLAGNGVTRDPVTGRLYGRKATSTLLTFTASVTTVSTAPSMVKAELWLFNTASGGAANLGGQVAEIDLWTGANNSETVTYSGQIVFYPIDPTNGFHDGLQIYMPSAPGAAGVINMQAGMIVQETIF